MVERMLGFGDDILDLVRIRDIQFERSHALTLLNHKIAECVGITRRCDNTVPVSQRRAGDSRPKPVEQPVINQTCDPSFLPAICIPPILPRSSIRSFRFIPGQDPCGERFAPDREPHAKAAPSPPSRRPRAPD